MALEALRAYCAQKGWKAKYHEEEGLGSLDFEARGLSYHVWEFQEDGIKGAESNVRTTGRQEDFLGDYEQDILDLLLTWK